jgi:hypothetical protein
VIVAAWAIYMIFIGLSSAANAMHAQDPIGAFLSAVLPVALALSTFLLERVRSSGGANQARIMGTVLVALGTAVGSFLHLYGLARDHGESRVTAALIPLAFDGVMLVSSMTIMVLSRERAPRLRNTIPAGQSRSGGWASPPTGARILPLIPAIPAIPTSVLRPRPILASVPRLEEQSALPSVLSPDAVLLRERFGDVLPSQRELKEQLGWGSTRVGNAIRELSAAG